MYKELSLSLKSFAPTEEELGRISNEFLTHKFIHSGDNLYGEKYEAWVYEYLKAWALATPEVSKFVKKSPDKRDIQNGLDYDKNGQIIYLQNGKKAAEYDGLFIYNGKIVFVESSVSEQRSYYRKLEDRLTIKRHYLVNLFKTEEVYYLGITRPKKRSLVYRSLPHLVLYKLKDPDFSAIRSTTQVSILNQKLVDLKTISSTSLLS